MGKNKQTDNLDARVRNYEQMQTARRVGGRVVVGISTGAFHKPGSNKK